MDFAWFLNPFFPSFASAAQFPAILAPFLAPATPVVA